MKSVLASESWSSLSVSRKAAKLRLAWPLVTQKLNWNAISVKVGIPYHALRMHFDSGYAEREQGRSRRRVKTGADYYVAKPGCAPGRPLFGVRYSKAIAADAAARMAEIPRQDNRTNTGRLLGDPLPERSALAQRESEG